MKSILSFSFSILFIVHQISTTTGQTLDWKWQHPTPTGTNLNDVHFVDENVGWTVGLFGTILKTSNGGQDWTPQSSGTNSWLYSIDFLDAQTGWVVGDGGVILKTTNGGQTWGLQNSPSSQAYRSVFFLDSQQGWAVGFDGTLVKTTNGGQSWQLRPKPGVTNQVLKSIFFSDALNGWIVGSAGTIRRTTDGGESWQSVNSGTSNDLNALYFHTNQVGWLVGDGGIVRRSTNGGQSWQIQSTASGLSFESVAFTDVQNGWIAGDGGRIFRTSNGGQNWISQTSGIANAISSIHFQTNQRGWTVASTGIILRTQDGGTTWESLSTGHSLDLSDVHFVGGLHGWAISFNGTLLRTTNSGKNWLQSTVSNAGWMNAVHFVDPFRGWIVGNSGFIRRTENGGITWSSQNSGVNTNLTDVFFYDRNRGWATGTSGVILRTTNGGTSWQSVNPGNLGMLIKLSFLNGQKGWILGRATNGDRVVYKTEDGGQTWESFFLGNSGDPISIQFVNSQTGWIVGFGGLIWKTNNGGLSWMPQTSNTQNNLHSLHFLSPQLGWVCGAGGVILKTTNGGNSWIPDWTGATNFLRAMHFFSPTQGWAVGNNGAILTTSPNTYVDPDANFSLLNGFLFERNAGSCNPSTKPFPHQVVKAEPGPFYGISSSNGTYDLVVPNQSSTSTYTLTPMPQLEGSLVNTVCPPSGQVLVQVDTVPDTLSGGNFGFDILPCHHLDVQISSNRRRRCFRNTTSVEYRNAGALAAPNAYVLVEFPQWVAPLSANTAYTAVSNSVWRFDVGTVAPGASGTIVIQDSVRCGVVEILAMSQCTRATVFPAPDCQPVSTWSGAEVSVAGRCENGQAYLGIYNRSAYHMPDSVDYWVYLDSFQVKTGKVKLASGDSLKFQVVVPNGMGVYLSVNQVAHHPTQVFVSTAVEGCQTSPIPLSMTSVSTHLPISQQPNSKIQCLPIIGAYDPNDKQVFPLGFTNRNVVAPDTRLEYLIRFQNTGNDTAFTVYVIDTLDANLNVESFEMGAASHPYQLRMQTTRSGKTYLRWQFNNILLPDSNTNEPASNGFIQFRISPKADLSLGTKVRNHADIYFDFNPPITTNRTLTTYDVLVFENPNLSGNVQVITSSAAQLAQLGVKLYPNPVKGSQVTASFSEPGSLTLFDARGVAVYTKDNMQGTEVLPVHLKPGLYVARIQTQKGQQGVKLVVE